MINANETRIETKKENILNDSMVSLKVWYCHDAIGLQDYNHEYQIENELTGQQWARSQYCDGDNYKSKAEKIFAEQVEKNKQIIERVRTYLAKPSHKPYTE